MALQHHHRIILGLGMRTREVSETLIRILGIEMKKFWQESCWVWLVVWLVVMASLVRESKAAPCGSTFISAIIQLLPCRPAVSLFRPFPPTEACCAAVRSLGQPCLCVVVNGPPIVGVDRNMALQLPDKCTANFEPCELGK